jgi:hypothetical protein
MVRLQGENPQEVSEEGAGRKTETPLKVSEEHHVFPFSRFRFYLFTRKAGDDLRRDPVAAVQPVKVVLACLGSVPASTLALFRDLGIF